LKGEATVIPRNRIPTHPGEVLRAEFLEPLGLSQVALAAHLGVPVQRINELIRGKRGITPETAWLLAQAFRTTPQFWINLQSAHDLARSRPTHAIEQVKKAS
jgi:addiction module HigA family antidote